MQLFRQSKHCMCHKQFGFSHCLKRRTLPLTALILIAFTPHLALASDVCGIGQKADTLMAATAPETTRALVRENVYIPPGSDDDQTILIIGELVCESSIGVTKTKKWKQKAGANNASETDTLPEYGTQGDHVYDRDDNFKQVRTAIAKVDPVTPVQDWALKSFAINTFFDDKKNYGVWSMNYRKTNEANDYSDQKCYFIETWRSYASDAYESGSGTQADPYLVKTPEQLSRIAKHVNADFFGLTSPTPCKDTCFAQIASFDLAAHYWEPVGIINVPKECDEVYIPFSGTYDGRGHIITSALSILPVRAMGLFGYAKAGTVKRTFSFKCDFTLTRDVAINGDIDAGGDGNALGGIAGIIHTDASNTYIDRCESHGQLKQYGVSGRAIIGGVTGGAFPFASTSGKNFVRNSFAVSEITAGNSAYIGGLVGTMSSNSNLHNGYSKAEMTSGGSVGSLVGHAASCEVKNCYSHNTERMIGGGTATTDGLYAPQKASDYDENYVKTYAPTIGADQLGYMYADNYIVEGETRIPLFEKLNRGAETLNGNANMTEWQAGVRNYDRWARPALAMYYNDNGNTAIMKPINNDHPVLLMSNYGTAQGYVGSGDFRALSTVPENNAALADGYVLQYSGPIRDGVEIDGMLSRSKDSNCDNNYHFIYGDLSNASTVPTTAGGGAYSKAVSIYEHASILHVGTLGDLENVYVGVTFDNIFCNALSTDGVNYLGQQPLPRDWHMFSTPLKAAPMGFDYIIGGTKYNEMAYTSGDSGAGWYNYWKGTDDFKFLPGNQSGTNNQRFWMHGWADSKAPTPDALPALHDVDGNTHAWNDGYFPSAVENSVTGYNINEGCISGADEDQRYPYGMDFYCWDEPNYHYVNFKRNGPNHWHTDEPHNNLKYKRYKADGTLSKELYNELDMTLGKGYMASISRKTLLQSHGMLNGADRSITATYTDTAMFLKGWNLIGNPYHGYIDFHAFKAANSQIEGNLYVVYNALQYHDGDTLVGTNGDSSGTYGDAFCYYVSGGSINGAYASRLLHPHQGFYVKVTSEQTLKFKEDHLLVRSDLGGNSSLVRDGIDDDRPAYPLVNLFLSSDKGCSDVCVVEFNRPEIGGAKKLRELRSGNGLFYAYDDDVNYAALFATPDMQRIPIKFESKESSGDTYTIRWNMANGDFSKLILVDNKTGVQYDMLANNSYSFQARQGDYYSRFYITFDVTGVDEQTDDDDNDNGSVHFAFFDGSQWVVTGGGNLDMIDLQGRLLHRTNLGPDGQSRVNLPDVASGMYLLRLTNTNGTHVQKIIVK